MNGSAAPGKPASSPLRVVAFTGGEEVPGARFRVRAYVAALRELGVRLEESPSRFGTYPPRSLIKRPFWAGACLASRLYDISTTGPVDVTLFQREFLSTFVTLEPLTKRPRVLDVDDAIWVHRGGGFARRLAGLCDLVLCGNDFLAERFSRWSRRVEVLPTVVDTERFVPAPAPPERPVIGWSGTSSTLRYLSGIEEPLRKVLATHPCALLRVVCDEPPQLPTIPPEQIEFIRWSPEREVAAIQGMTVGLMPLNDTEVSRGKCGLKMLLYLACGVPVVVSPVGVNSEVLAKGDVGRAASTASEWEKAVTGFLREPLVAREAGRVGRELVVSTYSVRAAAPRLAALLYGVAGREAPKNPASNP